MYIIKDNIRYELIDGLHLESPFEVYLNKNVINITGKYNYFKRTVGALNSNFKMQFIVISNDDKQYFYQADKDRLLNDEQELNSYVKFMKKIAVMGGK